MPPSKLIPSEYQREAVRFLLSHRHAALFADPGLGKTVITLLTLRALRAAYGRLRVLISAPIRVVYNVWPAEIAKWGFDFSYSILHGLKKDQEFDRDVEIQLINPEGLKWLSGKTVPKRHAIVVDESSQYKNPTSVRFKLLQNMLPYFKHRYILSGTPTPKSLMDLWSQMYILDLGEALGKKITHYRDAYFAKIREKEYFDYQLNSGMDEIIYAKTAPLSLRLSAETHLDLPELVHNTLHVTLPKPAAKLYRTMAKELFIELESGGVSANSAAAKYAYCVDIAGGAIYTTKPRYAVLHDEKIEAVKELAGELQGKPLMIAYRRWHEHARLSKAFLRAPAVNGKTKTKAGTRILEQWNRGELPILLVQCQSITHGLNLQSGGHDLVWFSIPDNYEIYEQLNRRLYRRGVREQVRIHHIVARGTLDPLLVERLRNKKLRQENLFDAILDYYRATSQDL